MLCKIHTKESIETTMVLSAPASSSTIMTSFYVDGFMAKDEREKSALKIIAEIILMIIILLIATLFTR